MTDDDKKTVELLAEDISNLTLAYRMASSDANRIRLFCLLEVRSAELHSFLKKVRENGAI